MCTHRTPPETKRWLGLAGFIVGILAFTSIAAFAQNAAEAENPPLQGFAYAHTRYAYEAFSARDYPRAAAEARQAIALRPDLPRLRLLLVDSLIAANNLAEAATAADDALKTVASAANATAVAHAINELRARQATIHRRLAEGPATEAYKALDRGDVADAVAQARRAATAAPEIMAYRLLLVNALLAQNNLGEANAAAQAAVALNPADYVPLIWRAYISQKQGNRSAAIASFANALALPGLTEAQRRSIRLIAADAALAANDLAEARILLAELPADDPDVATRKAAAESLARPGAASATARVLPAPRQDCVTTTSDIVCSLQAASVDALRAEAPQAAPGVDAANRAYAAQRDGATALAIKEIRQAISEKADVAAYRLLLVNLLMSAGRYQEAERAATDALALNDHRGPLLAQRGFARTHLNDPNGAIADWNAALEAGLSPTEQTTVRVALTNATTKPKATSTQTRPSAETTAANRAAALSAERLTAFRSQIGDLIKLDRKAEARALIAQARSAGILHSMGDADLGYLYASVDDHENAVIHFDRAREQGRLPARATLDAGYEARRNIENRKAMAYFAAGLDAQAERKFDIDPQFLFDARRQMADLTRRWGINASVTYAKAGAAPNPFAATTPTGGYTAQLGTELYYRPESFGYRNGAIFEVFARLFQTLYDQTGGPTGIDTTQGVVGARWKPFGEHNLVLEVDKLFRLGVNARDDVLLRAAYSYSVGTDLRAVDMHWWTWQVYGEIDRYLVQPQFVAIAEGRFGHSFRVGSPTSNLVVFPHAVVAANYDDSLSVRQAVSAGAGASVRYWFGETRYIAPPSYLELTMQYRFKLAGDERAEGIFAQALVNY